MSLMVARNRQRAKSRTQKCPTGVMRLGVLRLLHRDRDPRFGPFLAAIERKMVAVALRRR
jgi:hypothetical protein